MAISDSKMSKSYKEKKIFEWWAKVKAGEIVPRIIKEKDK